MPGSRNLDLRTDLVLLGHDDWDMAHAHLGEMLVGGAPRQGRCIAVATDMCENDFAELVMSDFGEEFGGAVVGEGLRRGSPR